MKNNNNSIKAIIFTITFFLFILFISLFKGINLYNLKTADVKINHLYIKMDKKLILQADGVNIYDNKNYTKQVLNLHKTILSFIKIFAVFQEINIKNIRYDNFLIKNIKIKKKILTLKSKNLNIKAIISPNIKNSYINIISMDIPKYNIYISNSIFNFKFFNNKISLSSQLYLDKNSFTLNGYLQNNILHLTLSSPDINRILYNNINIQKAKDLSLNILLNLNNYKIASNIKISFLQLKYGGIPLSFNNISVIQNKTVNTEIQEIFVPEYKQLKNIYLKNTSFSYDYKHGFLTLNNRFLSCNYQNFNISLLKNNLVYSNIKNFNIKNSLISVKSDKYRLLLRKNLISVLKGRLFYIINNSQIKSSDIVLKSGDIKGDLQKIFTKTVKGTIYSFPFIAKNISADIKNKSLYADTAAYNNVKIKNIRLVYKKFIKFSSNALFNKNIKEILNHFLNVEIPLTQTGGYNDINTTVNLNKISFKTDINVKTSLFDLAGFNLYVPKAEVKINENNLTFKTENSALHLAKNIVLKYSGNGLVSFRQKNMLLKGIINSFKISNVINLKNYKENADINFTSATLKTKNSSMLIDFNKKQLIISPLKNILPYTDFYTFVKNGIILITFKKKIHIMSYLMTKLPILYKHSNIPILNKKTYTEKNLIKKLFLNITVGKNTTTIFNKNVFINNYKNSLYAQIKNMDLNLFPLEKLLLENNSTQNDLNYTVKINSVNSNIIYKTHKFLSQKASLSYKNSNINFTSSYKHSSVHGYTRQRYFLLEGKNFNTETFNAFLPKFDFFKQINCDFILVKSPDNFYTGKIYIKHAVIKKLKSLNNILAFINTIPSILSFSSPGFSAKGYKIKKGFVDYLLYKKILYFKQAKIYGNNIDFFAKGYIDLNKQYIFLKVTANLKVKINKIPIIGKGLSYLFFGKDGSLDIKMIVKGNLNNPKVKEDLGKDILMSPFNLFKRALTLPFHLF